MLRAGYDLVGRESHTVDSFTAALLYEPGQACMRYIKMPNSVTSYHPKPKASAYLLRVTETSSEAQSKVVSALPLRNSRTIRTVQKPWTVPFFLSPDIDSRTGTSSKCVLLAYFVYYFSSHVRHY
jgi:hypothetical protein